MNTVPDAWKQRLRGYLQSTCGEERDCLSAYDFPSNQSVQIHFPDGSFASFQYAFVVWNEPGDCCMVFTEHCGYHEFRVEQSNVEVVRTES